MAIVKPSLCLNTDDPEQRELYDFISFLPNGNKRNTSAFLKTLVDREYQKKKEWYASEKKKLEEEKKTQNASQKIKSEGGGITFKMD